MFQIVASTQAGKTTAHVGDGMLISWDSELLAPPWKEFMHPETNPMYEYMNKLVAQAMIDWSNQGVGNVQLSKVRSPLEIAKYEMKAEGFDV